MSQKQGVATCQDKMTDYCAKIFFGGYWAPGSTLKHRLVIIREKKCFLNLPNALPPPWERMYNFRVS